MPSTTWAKGSKGAEDASAGAAVAAPAAPRAATEPLETDTPACTTNSGKEVSSTTFGFIYIRRVLQPFEGQDMGVTALGQTLNKPRSRWLYSPMFGATKGKSLSLTPIQRASVAAS